MKTTNWGTNWEKITETHLIKDSNVEYIKTTNRKTKSAMKCVNSLFLEWNTVQ